MRHRVWFSCGVRLSEIVSETIPKPRVRSLGRRDNTLNFKAEQGYQRWLVSLASTIFRPLNQQFSMAQGWSANKQIVGQLMSLVDGRVFHDSRKGGTIPRNRLKGVPTMKGSHSHKHVHSHEHVHGSAQTHKHEHEHEHAHAHEHGTDTERHDHQHTGEHGEHQHQHSR